MASKWWGRRLAAASIGLAWFALLRPTLLGGPATFVFVTGVSMEPTMHAGDFVVLMKQPHYRVGDIVAYPMTNGGTVIHRIVGGTPADGYTTQGDNKPYPDDQHPRPEEILGRVWLRVPRLGWLAMALHQPAALALLAGAGAVVALDAGARSGRPRRRLRGAPVSGAAQGPRPAAVLDEARAPRDRRGDLGEEVAQDRRLRTRLSLGRWAKDAVLVLVCAAALLLALAYWAYQKEPALPATVEVQSYQHRAVFSYVVQTEASSIYPDGRVTSDSLASAASEGDMEQGPRVLASLVRGLDLSVDYTLDGPAATVSGAFSAIMDVSAGGMWTKTYELATPVAFEGTEYRGNLHVDLAQLREQLSAIEDETGYRANVYTITVLPSFTVRGALLGRSLDDTFVPAFSVQLDASQLVLDPALEFSENRSVSEQVLQEQSIGWRNWRVSVLTARAVGIYGGTACGCIAALLGAMVYMGLGLTKAEHMRAQYGDAIVEVTQADLSDSRVIEVAGMAELRRLAALDGQVILHRRLDDVSDLFFVEHGNTTFTYTVREEASRK